MRKSNNNEEWKKLISDYQSSGLTYRAWCEKNNKSLSALHYWLKKLNQTESNNQSEQQWVSISLKEQAIKHPAIILKIDNITIEILEGFNKSVLTDILSIVQQL